MKETLAALGALSPTEGIVLALTVIAFCLAVAAAFVSNKVLMGMTLILVVCQGLVMCGTFNLVLYSGHPLLVGALVYGIALLLHAAPAIALGCTDALEGECSTTGLGIALSAVFTLGVMVAIARENIALAQLNWSYVVIGIIVLVLLASWLYSIVRNHSKNIAE